MKTKLRFETADWTKDRNGYGIILYIKDAAAAQAFLDEMKPGKMYAAELKEHHERRSLSANSYLWALLDDLAFTLSTQAAPLTKEELYRKYIKEVGIWKDVHNIEPEAAKTVRTAWEMLGTGWVTEQVDYEPDGDHLVIRLYYGSSTYNTKQMSRLLDAVIADCKEQGIDVATPAELALLKEEWGK